MKNFDEADWKAMYMTLLEGITYAIEICEDKTVSGVLVKALLDAEECYIRTPQNRNRPPFRKPFKKRAAAAARFAYSLSPNPSKAPS